MLLYKTVHKEAVAEQIIDKSRFVAYIKPVETKEEADEFIGEIRKKHKDATHNVPAMVLGDKFQVQWASDDGEPQGTSGAPMVQMLVQEGITNVAIVVTRYFGGIKLGTGGLVRAYTSSASLALEAAGVRHVKLWYILTVKIDYTFLGKIENLSAEMNFSISNAIYEDQVTLELTTDIEEKEGLRALISEVTSGSEIILKEVEKNY